MSPFADDMFSSLAPAGRSPAPVFHIVAYKLRPDGDPSGLTRSVKDLQDTAKLNHQPYIRSIRGGKQHSPQHLHGGMEVVFIIEFNCEADRDYFVFSDPAFEQLKKAYNCTGVASSIVLDFTDDEF